MSDSSTIDGYIRHAELLKRPTSILVVDDDDNVSKMLVEVINLILKNCIVSSVDNGREALNRMASTKFGLVMLDLLMPGMNGAETLRKAESLGVLEGSTVVIMTGGEDDAMISECISLGAMCCIRKPVTLEQLRRVVSTLRL